MRNISVIEKDIADTQGLINSTETILRSPGHRVSALGQLYQLERQLNQLEAELSETKREIENGKVQ